MHTSWLQRQTREAQLGVKIIGQYVSVMATMRDSIAASLTKYDLHSIGVAISIIWMVSYWHAIITDKFHKWLRDVSALVCYFRTIKETIYYTTRKARPGRTLNVTLRENFGLVFRPLFTQSRSGHQESRWCRCHRYSCRCHHRHCSLLSLLGNGSLKCHTDLGVRNYALCLFQVLVSLCYGYSCCGHGRVRISLGLHGSFFLLFIFGLLSVAHAIECTGNKLRTDPSAGFFRAVAQWSHARVVDVVVVEAPRTPSCKSRIKPRCRLKPLCPQMGAPSPHCMEDAPQVEPPPKPMDESLVDSSPPKPG